MTHWDGERILQIWGSGRPGGGTGGEPDSPMVGSGSHTDWQAQGPFTGNLGEIQEQEGGLQFTNKETEARRG